MRIAVAFFSGVLFAIGLGVSGMLQPAKIIGFLDFFGAWDPTLLFVMVGAIPVYMLAWFLRRGRPSVWGALVPAKASHVLDGRLVLGASLFGIGWALAGVCPAPAITNVAVPSLYTVAALASVLAGGALSSLVLARAK